MVGAHGHPRRPVEMVRCSHVSPVAGQNSDAIMSDPYVAGVPRNG